MKLIATMQIGKGKGNSKQIWDICVPTIRQYAEKIGADFKIYDKEDSKFANTSFYMNKIGMIDYLFQDYGQVLAIDSDILINPASPDIFEIYPELDTFYGMDEGYTAREHLVQPYIDKYKIKWEKNEWGTYKHYNGGMYIYGYKCDLSYDVKEYLPIKGYEENFINYIIQKNKVKNINVHREWNKICSDNIIPRREAYFIHYAGPGHVVYKKKEDIQRLKLELVKSDYEYFYKCVYVGKENKI